MGKLGNVWERVANAADLATEPRPGVPLVELAGDERVLIENHHGVTQYSPDEICVRVCYGNVLVTGNRLEIAYMSKERLIITGVIECLRLNHRR